MHWDGTVTLGNIITALVILAGLWAAGSRAFNVIDKQLGIFGVTIDAHARLLTSHANRMEKQDEMLLRISGDMQRVLGRLEAANQQSVIDAAAAALSVVKAAEEAALKTVQAAAVQAAALQVRK